MAALRSQTGASNGLLNLMAADRLIMLASVPLMLEYESVLTRPEHLKACRLTPSQVGDVLDYLASVAEEVRLHYIWRPQLNDVADEIGLGHRYKWTGQCLGDIQCPALRPRDRLWNRAASTA